MSSWGGTYPDDGGVDYGLSYSSYQIMNPETAPIVPGYPQYSARKSVYVDPEASSYSYGNLVHRPAVSNDGQGFSLSSMAASLPSASDRVLSSDRLHSSINRTLTSSSSYRGDGLPGHYASSKTSSANPMPDVAYSSLHPSFESAYTAASTLASTMTQRPSGHGDGAAYSSAAATSTEQLYTSGDQSLRSTEDGSTGLSYGYGESKYGSSRRDSHSGGGISTGSLLSNGHVYVPDSHSAHTASHSYVVPSAASSQGRGISVATTSVAVGSSGAAGVGRGSSGGSGSGSGSSHRPSDSHRRSAGSLRGG
jgi:hypothetical protein